MTARNRPSRQERERFGDTGEVAAYLRRKRHTLENWRAIGYGPAWVKIGRNVVYDWDDVDEWLRGQRRGAA
jgi:hypothetical protein